MATTTPVRSQLRRPSAFNASVVICISGRAAVRLRHAHGVSGSTLALLQSLTNANVTGGLLSVYLVVTSLTTVRPASTWTRRIDVVAFLVGLGLAVVEIALGIKAFESPSSTIDGARFPAVFFPAAITAAAVAGDVRVMRSGPSRGGARLARHLWRMCFALFIAAASFFSIRARVARVLPEPFTTAPMRALPILLVFVAMFYWLWRVRGARWQTAGLPRRNRMNWDF